MVKKILVSGITIVAAFLLFAKAASAIGIIDPINMPPRQITSTVITLPAGFRPPPPPPPPPNVPPPPSTIPFFRGKGIVRMQAYFQICGPKVPYQGTFDVCEQQITLNGGDTVTPLNPKCYPLPTNRRGQGMVVVPSGRYYVAPPPSCLRGTNCLMDVDSSVYIKDPDFWNQIGWDINPQTFTLYLGQTVAVSAVGHNRLMLCPIWQ